MVNIHEMTEFETRFKNVKDQLNESDVLSNRCLHLEKDRSSCIQIHFRMEIRKKKIDEKDPFEKRHGRRTNLTNM